MTRIPLPYPVIVEGKYDKIKLESILDTTVIALDGFAVFKSDEKKALLRALSRQSKVIVLTDPDGAGLHIRSFLSGILPKDRVIHLYVPEIEGKERRKAAPSKQGLLGVEGIGADTLRALFEPFANGITPCRKVTKADMFADGLLGGQGSAERRRELCIKLGLPGNLSANAFLDIVNLLYGYTQYKELL